MLFFDDGKKLEKAFNQEQFDALVNILEKNEDKVATKLDVKELETKLQGSMTESEQRTKQEIEKLRAELKTDTEKLRVELKTDTEKLRTELSERVADTKHEILKWMMGMLVAQTALIVAVISYLR